jgi:heme A synthase
MKQAYRVLAFLVAAGVMFQAAAIAYGMFGLIKWIEGGGTLDQSTEVTPELGGYTGFSFHATGGIFVMPVIALLFLISSFFAKIPGGIKWALLVFGVSVLQVALGLFSHSVAGLGWLHGLNAMILFGTAVMAGMRVKRAVASKAAAEEPVTEPAVSP